MATLKQTLDAYAKGEGPLSKIAPDEPIFILRAQDILAEQCVDEWWIRAQALGTVHHDKVYDARQIAQEMREWPGRRNPT